MNCEVCEKQIPAFFEDTLKERELENFLDHVKTCGECHEELSIQFLVSEGLMRLENGESFSLDEELKEKLARSNHRIFVFHRVNAWCAGLELVGILALGITMAYLFL